MRSRRVLMHDLAGIATSIGGRSTIGQGMQRSRPPRMVLRASGGRLQRGALGSPRRLAYSVWPYAQNIQPGPPNWSARTAPPIVDEVLVFPVSPAPMPSNLPQGLYVFDVFAKRSFFVVIGRTGQADCKLHFVPGATYLIHARDEGYGPLNTSTRSGSRQMDDAADEPCCESLREHVIEGTARPHAGVALERRPRRIRAAALRDMKSR